MELKGRGLAGRLTQGFPVLCHPGARQMDPWEGQACDIPGDEFTEGRPLHHKYMLIHMCTRGVAEGVPPKIPQSQAVGLPMPAGSQAQGMAVMLMGCITPQPGTTEGLGNPRQGKKSLWPHR